MPSRLKTSKSLWTKSVTELLLNPATKKLLDAYVSDPAHALCLNGDVGVGLGSIAKSLAAELSDSPQTITFMTPEKGLISIERIRALYEQTRSIQNGRRCIIIDDADAMSIDAQNALLKLLEEPVHNVHFILTTHHETVLLATIRSRTQNVAVLRVDESVSRELAAASALEAAQQAQVLFLAMGRPAEIKRLCEDADYFAAQVGVVTDARIFLQATTYGRLKVIKKYTDRANALVFLSTCAKLLTFSLLKQRNAAAADTMEAFDLVMSRIEANGHVRTQLMYLVTKVH